MIEDKDEFVWVFEAFWLVSNGSSEVPEGDRGLSEACGVTAIGGVWVTSDCAVGCSCLTAPLDEVAIDEPGMKNWTSVEQSFDSGKSMTSS